MNIVRYEPWRLMGRLHREIDQLFGDAYATETDGNKVDRLDTVRRRA